MNCKRLASVVLMLGIAVLTSQTGCFAAQLLSNPGFEAGQILENQSTSPSTAAGWTFTPDPVLGSGCWDGGVTAWTGGTKVHNGSHSIRVFHYGGVYYPWQPGWRTAVLSQTPDVLGDSDYTATAWVYVTNVTGPTMASGFYATLSVQELDAGGNPVGAAHVYTIDGSAANVNKWKLIGGRFHTSANTVKVAFSLIAHWIEDCNVGHITWDDCGLSGPPVGSSSLLSNGGFEGGAVLDNTTQCATYTQVDWTASTDCAYGSGFWTATATWGGGPTIRSGNNAQRVFAYNGLYGHPVGPRTSSLSQSVAIVPGGTYSASAWVYAYRALTEFTEPFEVKLQAQELDALGSPIGEPRTATFNPADANAWTQLTIPEFVATTSTAKIKVTLLQTWNDNLENGHINWDDVQLLGPAPSGITVNGTVKCNGVAIEGAVVMVDQYVTFTGSDGAYSIDLPFSAVGTTMTFFVTADGCFTQKLWRTIPSTSFVQDFDLVAIGNNLLSNAGFDSCTVHTPYTTTPDSWTVSPAGVFGKESFWVDNPYPGYEAYIRSGAEAAGLMASSTASVPIPTDASISQTVGVQPNSPYQAKVWVRVYDEGGGWYEGSDQKAALVVEQLNLGGVVIDSHKEYVTNFSDWQQLSYSFTTLPSTVMVRISGWAHLINDYDTTFDRAVFDDFELNGAAGGPLPTLFGMVTSGGAPLAGATVNLPYGPPYGGSTITGSDGTWSLNPPSGTLYVDVTKPGYYPARATVTVPRSTPLNFDLVAIGNNILTNAGFDGPSPKEGWSELTIGPGNGYARDEANWVAPAQIYSNYNAMALFASYSVPAGHWIYQRVPVVGGTSYTAKCRTKIWVPAGVASVWGTLGDDQVAGLLIKEYDASGALILEHPLVASNELFTWEQLSYTFTAQPNTATIAVGPYVYMLEDASIGYPTYGWQRASFDDVELNGQLGPWGLSGTVKCGGVPVAGANVAVTISGVTTNYLTNSNGQYVATVPYGASCSIRVSKAGYYPVVKSTAIQGEMVVDFDLFEVNGNLLFNPNFDDPAGWSSGGWTYSGSVWPETNTAQWGTAFFYSEPQAVYMRGPNVDSRIYQDVLVQPGKSYTASVQFMPAKDPRYGTVWGTDPNQTAALYVQELDAAKAPVGEEHRVWATVTPENISQWQTLTYTIPATQSNTRYVRVGGFSHMVDNYDANLSRAIFDNFSLVGDAVAGSALGDLKTMADNAPVRVTGKIVTAKFNGYFYIEEPDRSSGIRVTGDANVGDRVDVLGTMGTISGERVINATNIVQRSSGDELEPLGVNNRSCNVGLSAVGLRLTVWGRVVSVNSAGGFFVITDGSSPSLKVYGSATEGDYVSVTGVLGAEKPDATVIPVMRAVTVTTVPE